jgi:regulator of replication initiation timing
MDWTTLLSIVLPAITGVAGWFTGRRKQSNDFLNDLQASINMLAQKNRELMDEVIKLREENAEFRVEISELNDLLSKFNITRKRETKKNDSTIKK